MHHCLRVVLLTIIGTIFGCYQPPYEGTPSGDGGSGGFGGSEEVITPPTSSSTTGATTPTPSQENEDIGFDPCPEDTYVLWENEEGVIFEVTIQVFCEPIQDMNLGCPGP